MTIHLFNKTTRRMVYTVYAIGIPFIWFLVLLSLGTWGLAEPMIVLAIIFSVFNIAMTIIIYREIFIEGTWESKITIDEIGLTMVSHKKTASLAWKHINMAGYGNFNRAIIFSSRFDTDILRKRVRYKHITNDCIFVELRPDIIQEIRKYWIGLIIGEAKHKKEGNNNEDKRY